MKRWIAKLLLAIASSGALLGPSAWAKSQVSVYYPSMLSVQDRQEALRKGLSGFEVTVFAKFKDFAEDIQAKSSEVLIAPATFQKYHPEYVSALAFLGPQGEEHFKYLVLALNEKWKPANLADGKLGMVEVDDRKNLKELAADQLSINSKSLKSVTKPEDLFPLLVFGAADFVILQPQNYAALKEKFSTKVFTVGESASTGFPLVFVKKGSSPETVIQAFGGLSKDILKALGFGGTKPIGKSP